MISFKDLPQETKMYDFYLPEDLRGDVVYSLKQAAIPYHSISWDDKYIDPDLKRKAIANYQKAKCPSTLEYMGILQVPIKPEDLFQKVKLLFGPDIDPDFKAEKNRIQKKSDEIYETCYQDWLQPGEIPVVKSK